MIINRQKRLEAKERKAKEREEKLRKQTERYEKQIEEDRQEMFTKPCPFNNMECCIDTCVHFQDGHTYYQVSHSEFGPSEYTMYSKPKCKLWK